jgi:hypothetical protein
MPAQDIYLWMGNDKPDIEKVVKLNYDLHAPLRKGEKAGIIDVYVEGKYLQSIDILCKESIKREPSILEKGLHRFIQYKGFMLS